MRNILFQSTICLLVFSTFSIHHAQAQMRSPAKKSQQEVYALNFHPSDLSLMGKSPTIEYGQEFLAAELGMLVGGAATFGLFYAGVALAGTIDNQPIRLLIGMGSGLPGFMVGLATPAFAAYLLHKTGQKFHDDGSFGAALLGSYSAALLGVGLTYIALVDINKPGLIIPASILPGLGGVLVYNLLSKSKARNTGSSLLNINEGKYSPGFPAFSVGTNPFAKGTIMGQVSLLSVRF